MRKESSLQGSRTAKSDHCKYMLHTDDRCKSIIAARTSLQEHYCDSGRWSRSNGKIGRDQRFRRNCANEQCRGELRRSSHWQVLTKALDSCRTSLFAARNICATQPAMMDPCEQSMQADTCEPVQSRARICVSRSTGSGSAGSLPAAATWPAHVAVLLLDYRRCTLILPSSLLPYSVQIKPNASTLSCMCGPLIKHL